jgi:hypothetical protein
MSKWLKSLEDQFRKLRDKVLALIKGASDDPTTPDTPSTPDTPTTPEVPDGEWPKACTRIEAAMVTPLFVHNTPATVSSQAKALRAGGFNAIASLVDLQTGRNYIFPGRTATALVTRCKDNIERVLSAGLTPVIIIRNDWALTGAPTSSIPSVGGQPASAADFYSATRLENEKQFLDRLTALFPYIHIQLSIESELKEAATFSLALATHLRAIGFNNRILINPIDEAQTETTKILALLTAQRCEIARTWHSASPSPDKIWNTDGRPDVNSGNVQSVLKTIRASGKEFILWTQELANSPTTIPSGYLAATAPTTPTTPPVADSNTFLWKPASDNDGKLAVLLPANIDASAVTVNGERHARYTGRANGNRQHFRFNKPGSSYGANAKVVATLTAGGTKTWTVPNGGARWESR